jgi:hypothetical protein
MPISIFICLPNNIKMVTSITIRWMGDAECMREKRNAYKILVEKPQGKSPFGRTRHR